LSPASASGTTKAIGVLGGSVTFHSHNTDGNAAFWSFENDPILTVPFEDPPQPIFSEKKFETRFAVSERGRALNISPLRMEDAGTYSVKINAKTSTFTLQVFSRCFYCCFGVFYTKREVCDTPVPPGELAEPTVTCEVLNCSDGSCSFSLRCSVPGAGFGNISYTWRVRDQPWAEGSELLWVNESSRDEPEPLTCTARNPVSSRSFNLTTLGVLCSGAVSSSQVGSRSGVIAGIVVLVVLLVFLVVFWKSKGESGKPPLKPWEGVATNDYTTVYAEVGPSQQRVPNRIKAKPADGGLPTTIYSLVKRPE
ncbi:SLAF5 protein, partial [Peucedramus taeniatus]|nr:SLAF5 protein [Peucedramus taeniatus]